MRLNVVFGREPLAGSCGRKPKSILFLQYPWRLWRTRLAGIYRYAAKAGWNVQIAEFGLTSMPIRRELAFWRPDGCIVEGIVMERGGAKFGDFGDTPVVFCDANRNFMPRSYFGVEQDSEATAMLAANELLSLGFDDYAFVGNIRPRDWSIQRQKVFAKAVSAAGKSFYAFAAKNDRSTAGFFKRIRQWLRELPKPCGIMAANDISGDLVLQACRMERIAVPEEISVVSIDNDELVCDHSTPRLTSVMPDFELSGFLAAKLLDEAMSGKVLPHVVKFGATHVVRRESAIGLSRRDDAILRAVERVRLSACNGLTPAEVCRGIGGSRRHAESRFRKSTGQSIGEAITEARIARAKALLLKRGIPIDTIFSECGYESPASMRRAFRNATGLSMRAWRNSQL